MEELYPPSDVIRRNPHPSYADGDLTGAASLPRKSPPSIRRSQPTHPHTHHHLHRHTHLHTLDSHTINQVHPQHREQESLPINIPLHHNFNLTRSSIHPRQTSHDYQHGQLFFLQTSFCRPKSSFMHQLLGTHPSFSFG